MFAGDKLGEDAPHSGRGEPVPREQGPDPQAVLGAGDAARQPRGRAEEPPVPAKHRVRQGAAQADGAVHPAHRLPHRHLKLRPHRPRQAAQLVLRLQQVGQRAPRQQDLPRLLRVHLPPLLRRGVHQQAQPGRQRQPGPRLRVIRQ